MQEKNILVNNSINVIGRIISKSVYSHSLNGEAFYNFSIEVPRLSETVDILPVIISERVIDRKNLKVDSYVDISGELRSRNDYSENEKRKLVLGIFVQSIKILDKLPNENVNTITLHGSICKTPIYRTTPFGREITDILLAVNRHYNKSDYLPCISWSRAAKFASTLKVGDNVEICGRFQSREYQKQYEDGKTETRTAYEVSVSNIKILEDVNKDN